MKTKYRSKAYDLDEANRNLRTLREELRSDIESDFGSALNEFHHNRFEIQAINEEIRKVTRKLVAQRKVVQSQNEEILEDLTTKMGLDGTWETKRLLKEAWIIR